ncbi:phage holin family protein [Phytohabitans sp. LJ34]|uniref:phage holin family protein n=1 Tax=Phytohabitans sp. LJ34 TaxID=3452217 RepID=UPI003F8CDBF9
MSDAGTGELVRQAADQITRLVRDELALARAEMVEKGKRVGTGAGLLGGGGVVALYGVAALLAAIVLGLAEAMPAWLSALIVAAALFAVAGVLAVIGRRQVAQGVPPVPREAVQSVQADIEEVRGRAQR